LQVVGGQFVQETARFALHDFAVAFALFGVGERERRFRARDADIGETPLFLDGGVGVRRVFFDAGAVRQQAFSMPTMNTCGTPGPWRRAGS